MGKEPVAILKVKKLFVCSQMNRKDTRMGRMLNHVALFLS